MTFSSLRSNTLTLIGDVATTHPEAWVLSWAFLGLATGVLIYAGLGWFLGGLLGHGLVGSWCGLGLYSYWLAANADRINGQIDQTVETLRSFRLLK